MTTAKTPAERQAARRQREAEQGKTEVRGIFAPTQDHARIKRYAKGGEGAAMDWVPFDQSLWARQPLPPARRYLLVQIAARQTYECGMPPAVAVGYLRFAAGDKDSPVFTIPGVGGTVVAWCDCLGDDFMAPLWPGTHKKEKAQ